MTSLDSPTARLRALLHDAAMAPRAHAEQLAAARTELAAGLPVANELLAAELRWLSLQREMGAEALAEAKRQWRLLRVRRLLSQPADRPAVLFDLAELQAESASAGDAETAAACDAAIQRGLDSAAGGPALREEANERFAALASAIEDLPLPHQVALLRRTGRLLLDAAARNGSSRCRRLGRRLARAADDRELAHRLELRLGRRGTVALETTSFVLLLVVLVLLVVEATVALTPAQTAFVRWVDAGACTFFIADFCFELWLHPRRSSWFVRRAATDLLPAVLSVLFLLPGIGMPAASEDAVAVRVVRLLRITWLARYVQALQPLLRSLRLLLFLVRGMDGLVHRFSRLLNREFVFVPGAAEAGRRVAEDDRRELLFAALRRERELARLLTGGERSAFCAARAAAVADAARTMPPIAGERAGTVAPGRDVPVEEAVEFLWSLRPQDVATWLSADDVRALDRVVRVVSAAPVRWLPIVRRFAVHPLPPAPEERIVRLGRRVAEWLGGFHGRLLFFADLHGIVTGPQILDRVASAMVKASQRPAVRLLLFGGLFLLFDLLLPYQGASSCLRNIVVGPLLVLGSVCLVFLSLGWWLKRIAGEASESYRLCSEAHFISQLELVKRRHQHADLAFLARRVFGPDAAAAAEQALRTQVIGSFACAPVECDGVPEHVLLETNRVALLYQHFLDGAVLHETDVKTTEQLIANLALDNLRSRHLRHGKRDRRRLKRLKLDDGSIFAGPYLWFRFITESIAVETAKRIAGYNRVCIPVAELDAAGPEEFAAMAAWLEQRRDPRAGRTLGARGGAPAAAAATAYRTTEFTALDFIAADPDRDAHLRAMFGSEVLAVLQQDRRTMVREIFGTRPVHHLPKQERSFNPLRFYQQRLSRGRVLFAPLLLLWRFARTLGWLVGRVRQIVREVFDPELAMRRREAGEAPFAVALRKIHRMKAPGLLEAVRMRLQLDPVYAGAPPGWSFGEGFRDAPELEGDMAFLHLHERERVDLRERAAAVRRQVQALHAALAWLPELRAVVGGGAAAGDRVAVQRVRDAELAVTCAWIADKDDVRTLLFAERWRTDELPRLREHGAPGSRLGDLGRAVASLFSVHCVDRWLERHGRGLPPSVRRALLRAHAKDRHGVRAVLRAWSALPAGASPADAAIARLRHEYTAGPVVARELAALRTVQSLAVLDVRNYRDLVFRLGGYADDGEDAAMVTALP